jgi:hypothetical protein
MQSCKSRCRGSLDLERGDTLLCFTEEQSSGKPLHKRQVGIIEYGASGNGKLVIAIFTVEELFFGFEFDYRTFAAEAARTFRPAQADKQLSALVFGCEQSMNIH